MLRKWILKRSEGGNIENTVTAKAAATKDFTTREENKYILTRVAMPNGEEVMKVAACHVVKRKWFNLYFQIRELCGTSASFELL